MVRWQSQGAVVLFSVAEGAEQRQPLLRSSPVQTGSEPVVPPQLVPQLRGIPCSSSSHTLRGACAAGSGVRCSCCQGAAPRAGFAQTLCKMSGSRTFVFKQTFRIKINMKVWKAIHTCSCLCLCTLETFTTRFLFNKLREANTFWPVTRRKLKRLPPRLYSFAFAWRWATGNFKWVLNIRAKQQLFFPARR